MQQEDAAGPWGVWSADSQKRPGGVLKQCWGRASGGPWDSSRHALMSPASTRPRSLGLGLQCMWQVRHGMPGKS